MLWYVNLIAIQIVTKEMPIIPKLIYKDPTQFQSKPNSLFCRNWHADSIIYMEKKRTQSRKTILKKKTNIAGLILPHFKVDSKATVTQILQNWWEKHTEQINIWAQKETQPYVVDWIRNKNNQWKNNGRLINNVEITSTGERSPWRVL